METTQPTMGPDGDEPVLRVRIAAGTMVETWA